MKLQSLWPLRRNAVPSGDRLARLRKVLSKAEIPFRKADPEAVLIQVKPSSPRRTLPALRNQKLVFPIEATERVAVVAEGFAVPPRARVFDARDIDALREYRPQGLVASAADAFTIAGAGNAPALEDALVVLSNLNDETLSPRDRDRFWKAFGIPVFEYLQSWDGTVIARECEVHDGLHVLDDTSIIEICDDEFVVTQLNRVDIPIVRWLTGVTGTLVREHCECGLETPRLRNLASIRSQEEAAA